MLFIVFIVINLSSMQTVNKHTRSFSYHSCNGHFLGIKNVSRNRKGRMEGDKKVRPMPFFNTPFRTYGKPRSLFRQGSTRYRLYNGLKQSIAECSIDSQVD